MSSQYDDLPTSVSQADQIKPNRLESIIFYVLLATIVLAPLAFLPTPYVSLDAVKTILIAFGVLISALLQAVLVYKERSLDLPSRSISWSSILVAISLIVSAILSGNTDKSFFGQGFEINTVSFILALFVSGLTAFILIKKRQERAAIIYVGITASFLILVLFHSLRFIIGQSFMTLGVLSSLVTTLTGSWYDLATYSLVISLIALTALMFLPLSRGMKYLYSIILIVSLLMAFVVNNPVIWFIAFLVFAGLEIYLFSIKSRPSGSWIYSFLKRVSWVPLVCVIVAGLLSWKGVTIATPIIRGIHAEYTSLNLPWQLSLDVTAGALKENPLFGVGPDRFSQAYISYRPMIINSTNAWGTEFNYAFGLLPTFIATQGLFGLLTWFLLLVFIVMSIVRSLRHLPEDSHNRFLVVSSSVIVIFLWSISLVSVPSHVLVFYTFIATALALGIFAHNRIGLPSVTYSHNSRRLSLTAIVFVVIFGIWTVYYIKDAAALAYFGSGAKVLSISGDTVAADKYFARAYNLNASDIYLQARVETGITKANKLISSISQNTPATTSQMIVGQIVDTVNTAIGYAKKAISYDPTNYYNYLSEARILELATNIRMDKAYENAVTAYTQAIRINPLNPSLYLNLARLQASQSKFDDSLKTLGNALQVKSDYLDAIFLLSQVSAAQGNLKDAITAAQVATQINDKNPVLFFQLGLLRYNNKEYQAAAQALEKAVELQSDYANARYFLGLSYVRLGNTGNAIEQFNFLSETNPENEEVSLILTNLKAGKSPFADAKPPVTPNPEKRSSLPVKQKQK